MNADPVRARLHLVEPSDAEPVWFCTWCGERQADDVVYAGSPIGPPCVYCGHTPVRMADASVAPPVGAAFMTIDASGRIVTTSRRAVSLLELPDDGDGRGARLRDVLLDAEAEGTDEMLREAATAIACGRQEAYRIIVRQPGTFGVHYVARLAVCRPPRATLIVLTPHSHAGASH